MNALLSRHPGVKKKPNKTIDFQNMTLGTMEAIKNSFLFEQDTFFEAHSQRLV